MYTFSVKRPKTPHIFRRKKSGMPTMRRFRSLYKKSTSKDVMKLRLNTGFEGVTRFVILRLIRHLAVEARHCVRRFARHFIKIWRVSRSALMWTWFQWTIVLTTRQRYTSLSTNARVWAIFNTTFFLAASYWFQLVISESAQRMAPSPAHVNKKMWKMMLGWGNLLTFAPEFEHP